MNFEYKHFSELSLDELYDILKLRSEIFVVEQNCIYNDLDDLDKEADHQLLRRNGEIIAYARLLKPGTRFAEYSIGRVVVKHSERGNGLGIRLMEEARKYMVNNWGASKIKVSAQKYLRKFYENLGFEVTTEEYLEDGIPHIGMTYQSQNSL